MATAHKLIPLDKLDPALWNPRTVPDPAALEDLTASIKVLGVIEPIIVRPGAGDRFDVVAGSRRTAAARTAGLKKIPAVVRELTDQEAAEVALAENIQTETLGPLDEAAAYDRLLAEQPLRALAIQVGKSRYHVRRRLALLDLDEKVRDALRAGRITLAHADRLGRVPRPMQAEALNECFYPLFRDHDNTEPAPIATLDAYIARHVRVEPDEDNAAVFFPGLVADRDSDSIPSLIKLSESSIMRAELGDQAKGVIGQGRWVEIGRPLWPGADPVAECENVVEGVVVHGGPVRVIRVCAQKGCPVHRPPAPKSTSETGSASSSGGSGKAAGKRQRPPWEIDAEKREAEHKRWVEERPGVLKLFAAHVADLKPTPAILELLIGDWNMQRIREFYGPQWELSIDNLAATIALAEVFSRGYGREGFKGVAKAFGFKMPLRENPKRAKAKKPAAPKMAAKTRRARRAAKLAPEAAAGDQAGPETPAGDQAAAAAPGSAPDAA